jgi:D-alanyl-D-alanine carboxypeptidase
VSARRAAPIVAAGAVLIALLIALALPAGRSEGGHGAILKSRRAAAYTLTPAARPAPAVPLARLPRAGLLFDVHSGAVLWEHDPLRHLRIASLTKMMTALIVAERTTEREAVPIVASALHVGGSRLGFRPSAARCRCARCSTRCCCRRPTTPQTSSPSTSPARSRRSSR